jgi:hypothetical protein
LPRDFARINLLQWFSRAGFGDETVFLRHEIRLKQSRVVAKSKRANEVALPVTSDSKAAYAARQSADETSGSEAIVKVA